MLVCIQTSIHKESVIIDETGNYLVDENGDSLFAIDLEF